METKTKTKGDKDMSDNSVCINDRWVFEPVGEGWVRVGTIQRTRDGEWMVVVYGAGADKGVSYRECVEAWLETVAGYDVRVVGAGSGYGFSLHTRVGGGERVSGEWWVVEGREGIMNEGPWVTEVEAEVFADSEVMGWTRVVRVGNRELVMPGC